MSGAAQVALDYATQAFPNVGPDLLRQIISKYGGVIFVGAYGLINVCVRPLWEYIYDRLMDHDAEAVPILAAYKKLPKETVARDVARIEEKPPNGYSSSDKQIIEQILKDAKDQRPKEQLKIYDKKGTLDDAKADLKKLGDGSDGKKNELKDVWTKTLSNGKEAIARVESTDPNAHATFEVQTTVDTNDGRKFTLPIIKVRYY